MTSIFEITKHILFLSSEMYLDTWNLTCNTSHAETINIFFKIAFDIKKNNWFQSYYTLQ